MNSAEPRSGAVRSTLEFDKFCDRAPDAQNVVDLFYGRWASDLSEVVPGLASGASRLFREDTRPRFLLKNFANPFGNLEGCRILELGPLEGAHTFQLERLGASEIVAIEANAEAYLKCLIVKELFGLTRSRFLYGDFVKFFEATERRFDIIFCCGVLYHMEDPLKLIEMMSNSADRLFIWTHYWAAETGPRREAVPVERFGEQFAYHRLAYGDRGSGTFWGGNADSSSWLSRPDILRAVQAAGMNNVDIHAEHIEHQHGPCFSLSAWR
jgi:Methyltransferase domain